jgi:DNA-directed RNA polymerase subunit RPC12/RpoP
LSAASQLARNLGLSGIKVAGRTDQVAGGFVESPNFTRRAEDFGCLHCGAAVRGNGYTNHCPHCLWSRHVDVRPGDRAAECGGAMEPVGALYEGGRTVVVQRCQRCGHTRRNKTARDDAPDAVLALFGRVVEDPRR